MFEGVSIVFLSLLYVTALFVLAWVGDHLLRQTNVGRPLVYALSLGVYCTSWTFLGSVGLAARSGYDFIPVYLGPILMFTFGWPIILRVVRLAKSQNITSVSDFLAARYGKSQDVALVATLVVVIGTLPYIALQLKAIAVAIETMLGGSPLVPIEAPQFGFADTAMFITIALTLFAFAFGTRHIDATEHQHGMILAIAAESVFKLIAFIAVGLFAVFALFDGPADFVSQASASEQISQVFSQGFNGGLWLTVTFLSFVCIILLPRQFHVTVVENNSDAELKRARWMFPVYLILINIFVIPIAAAGLLLLPPGTADSDFFILALPMSDNNTIVSLIAFVGGLSAATAMVIVETIALSIMIGNGIVVPLLLRSRLAVSEMTREFGTLLLSIRRIAIVAVLGMAYIVYKTLGETQGLAAIGLISFVAVAQLAPAFFGALFWRAGTARGAIAGLSVGFAMWVYTLLLPWMANSGFVSADFIENGPLGIGFLRPQALLYLEFHPLTHGVLWSLSANLAAFIAVSLLRPLEPIERLQAHVFIQDENPRVAPQPAFRVWQSSITVGDLQDAVARYLGTERAARSFREFAASRSVPLSLHAEADLQIVRFTEHLLTSAIGAPSSRLVLSLLLRRGNVSGQSALKLLDDASEALQHNRDLLQSALDQVRHGLSVFDKDMRLICWNRQFRQLLDLPPELGRVGVPLDRILRQCALRGDFGEGKPDDLVADRLVKLAVTKETFQERTNGGERILEIRTSPMPQGGIVTTFSDITDRMSAATALARANETLERRVRERTAELLEVNAALAVAKSKADEASQDKTRFLAAASHDILQPLNAARLYATSLNEMELPDKEAGLASNVDASLAAVEEIFSAIIDISRMDAGRLHTDVSEFPLMEIIEQLKLEFEPIARGKGLALEVATTEAWVRSDRRLLRRLLQNLLSNAVKYTPEGTVRLTLEAEAKQVRVAVADTGPGIPKEKHELIFKEFHRLESAADREHGLGLGLSIVERIGRTLGHEIAVASEPGCGAVFTLALPRAKADESKKRQQAAAAFQPGNLGDTVVMCIENEPAVLAGMEALLTGWGCKVISVASEAQALNALRGESIPEAIMADYHLDEGTGVEAVMAVRAALGSEVPAVIITADHTPQVQRDIRENDLIMLRKPLKAAALRAILNQNIRRRATAAE